jgi:hypothetical protein
VGIGREPEPSQYPATARSLGSINSIVFKEIQCIAREDEILTDPLYSSKLLQNKNYGQINPGKMYPMPVNNSRLYLPGHFTLLGGT